MRFSRFNTLRAVVDRRVDLERFVILQRRNKLMRTHLFFLLYIYRPTFDRKMLLSIVLRSKLNVAVFIRLFGSNDFPFIRVQFFFFFFFFLLRRIFVFPIIFTMRSQYKQLRMYKTFDQTPPCMTIGKNDVLIGRFEGSLRTARDRCTRTRSSPRFSAPLK